MRAKLSGILLLSAVMTLATPLFAQTFGQITGLVTDPSGAVLVGAAVTVTNPQTSFTRTENTNGAGIYTFPSLLPGAYNVRVGMQGFQSAIRNDVELQVQQVPRLAFQMPAGCAAGAFERSTSSPLVNTRDPTVRT